MRHDQTDRAFCQFVSMVYGWRAAFMVLRRYYYKHNLHTVRGIVSRWAPAEDHNDTEGYINIVCKGVPEYIGRELSPDEELPDPDTHPLLWGIILATMAFVETGAELAKYSTFDELLVGWHLMELAAGPKAYIGK